MSAHKIAAKAHEQALEAAHMEALYEEAVRMDRDRDRRLVHERYFETAIKVLDKWFPGVEWTWNAEGDFGGDTILREKGSNWNDPLKLKIELIKDAVRIQIGDYVANSSMPGYNYFSGTEVKSAADVGRWLAARKKRAS